METHCTSIVNGKRRLCCYWLARGGRGVVAGDAVGRGDGVSRDLVSHGKIRVS